MAAHELLKFYGEVSLSVFLAGKVQSLPQSLRGVFDLPGHESEQNLRDSEGQGSLACCSPSCCKVEHVLTTKQQQGGV